MSVQRNHANTRNSGDSSPLGESSSGENRPAEARRLWQLPAVEDALLTQEVKSAIAHVRMLEDTSVISQDAANRAILGLQQVATELMSGKNFILPTDADIYSGLERRLTELVGEAASALTIARERSEQIATDIRMWLRSASLESFSALVALRSALVDLAERDIEMIMPSYKHMQPHAQVRLSIWWLANESRLERDFSRLKDMFARMNMLPAGQTLSAQKDRLVDKSVLATHLAFGGTITNELDAISDRDYIVEFSCFASLVGVHISQMVSDLLVWSTQEFGFVRLPRTISFQGQMMPDNKVRQLLEILRSRASSIGGRLTELLGTLNSISVSYSQDLEELLPAVMEVVDNLKFMLELSVVLVPAFKFDTKRMIEAANIDRTSTSHALDFLLERGVPYDKAARAVESMLEYCKQRNRSPIDLTLNEFALFSPAFDETIYDVVAGDQVAWQSRDVDTTDQVASLVAASRKKLSEDTQSVPHIPPELR